MTKTIGGSQSSPGRLSGLDLYVVAAVCMAVDHVGHCLGDIAAMRAVGRLSVLSVVFIGLYDGTPGRAVRLAKYGFYPAHLLVLGAIVMLFGRM